MVQSAKATHCLLLQAKNINSQDRKGRTALHAAVISNSLDCARLLLMNGADPNIRQRPDPSEPTSSLKSPLHLASERGHPEMVRLLAEFGGDVFAKDANGLTAMDLAEQQHHTAVVEVLAEALAEFERKREDQYKTLAIAVHRGDIDLVVQMGAPKGSSRLLQRIGRANHRLDEPSKAMLVPSNRFEVLECEAALEAVAENQQDSEDPRPRRPPASR